MRQADVHHRLLEKTRIMPNGCIEWHGYAHEDGYGFIKIKGQNCLTHRVSWEINNGPIPEGLCVLHKCDNPPCINPEHLFLGTKQDNMNDCIRKGRAKKSFGDKHPNVKVKDSVLPEIIKERGSGVRVVDLVRKYGLKKSQIYNILNGKGRIALCPQGA